MQCDSVIPDLIMSLVGLPSCCPKVEVAEKRLTAQWEASGACAARDQALIGHASAAFPAFFFCEQNGGGP